MNLNSKLQSWDIQVKSFVEHLLNIYRTPIGIEAELLVDTESTWTDLEKAISFGRYSDISFSNIYIYVMANIIREWAKGLRPGS